jgi:hypothetical protein
MGTKVRWGDTLDDEDALPPTTVKGPDANGVKVVTEYYKGDKGEAFKKTTKTKIVKVEKKVYKVRDEAEAGEGGRGVIAPAAATPRCWVPPPPSHRARAPLERG